MGRIREGELPEHFGEVSMKRNYTQDPKFNATCVCDGLPKQTMQSTSSATTGPEYSGGTSGYWKEKQAKKLEKLKRKEEKEKENNLKRLLEERQEIRFGEVPERNQTDPDWNYEACAREIQRQLAYKLAEQRKHAMKD